MTQSSAGLKAIGQPWVLSGTAPTSPPPWQYGGERSFPVGLLLVWDVRVRSYNSTDEEPVVAFALRAWTPVFASLQAALGAEIFDRLHPDWQANQDRAVRAVLLDSATHVWVAEAGAGPVGFAAAKVVDDERRIVEPSMLSVDPAPQGDCIEVALSQVAIEWMRKMGMLVGMIDTGGDPGHAPARRVYEKAGYGLLPIARCFKVL